MGSSKCMGCGRIEGPNASPKEPAADERPALLIELNSIADELAYYAERAQVRSEPKAAEQMRIISARLRAIHVREVKKL